LGSSSRALAEKARGATFKQVNRADIGEMRMAFPAYDEQRRIAHMLDAADALLARRRVALARLEGFVHSAFLKVFGDPVRNPRSWPAGPLGKLGQLNRGVSKHRPRNAPELLGGPYPLIQTGDVASSGRLITQFRSTYSEAGLSQSKLWPVGTLCITIAANIADTGVLTFDACFPDSVVAFTADPATTRYVQVWLSFLQRTLRDAAPESAQKNINLKILRELPIPEPPLELRRRFAECLGVAEGIERLHIEQLTLLNALFASLQSRAFAGEL
jgi:type I restriction enzyme S subunit